MNSDVTKFFQHNDPILARLADKYGLVIHIPDEKPFTHFLPELCRTIVGQQLSVKAAATIWARTKNLVQDWDDPYEVLAVDIESYRKAGLSRQKASYVKNIAQSIIDSVIKPEHYAKMDESLIVEELTKIKGVGIWTAEMFLIFSLGRKDVFSVGDLGLQNAIKNLYGDLNREQLLELSRTWSPYRSYASMLLWKSLDNEPT